MTRHPGRLPPAADLNSASSRGRRFNELLADEANRSQIVVVVVDVERSATEEPRRRLEDRVEGPDQDDQRPRRRHLVLTDTLTFLATAIADLR
jgi:hypothetical protein